MNYVTTTGLSFQIRPIRLNGNGYIAVANAEDHDVTVNMRRPWANERLAIAAIIRKIERTFA